jgi:hypothetical protein
LENSHPKKSVDIAKSSMDPPKRNTRRHNHRNTWWKCVKDNRYLIEVEDSTKVVEIGDEKEFP